VSATPPPPAAARRRANLAGLAAVLMWSTLALFTTETRGLPPFETLALTFTVAAAGGFASLTRTGGLSFLRRPPPAFYAVSFGGLFVFHALYFYALTHAEPASANLLNYLWPLLIVLMGGREESERGENGPLLRRFLGAALGFAAVLLLSPAHPSRAGSWPGLAAALASALTWATYSVLNRRFADVPSGPLALSCLFVAGTAALVTSATTGWTAPTPRQWAALVLIGLGPAGLAIFLWDHATKKGSIALLGALAYLAPLLSTLWLVAMHRAAASPALWLAVGLIIGGVVLARPSPAAPRASASRFPRYGERGPAPDGGGR
jgi:drug/metabolite transporter (DMT)-like permease